ncbi:MAG: hypothetical protein GY832_43255 [Chloroflexi bacterium]|nr:hypothetical protein [Chloroflexota bacterium]
MAGPDLEQLFEQSLEHCLQDLEHTGDIESCLQHYPQYADRLRPLLEMAQLARQHYEFVPQPPSGLLSGRERLLAEAAQQRARATSKSKAEIRTTNGPRRRFAFATRFIGILLSFIIGVGILGGGIVLAANDSLPGDRLYPVKITVEDVRLSLVFAPQDRVSLTLEFVEERVSEIQALLESKDPVSEKAIARMEQHVEQSLVFAAQISSDEEIVDALGQITAHTRSQAQVLEQAQSIASQHTRARLMQAIVVCRQGAETAEIGLDDLQTFRSRYRHQQGTLERTNESRVLTVTPRNDQEQHRGYGQEGKCTPTLTPVMTPCQPQATQPQNTPQGPRSTLEQQPTPQGPRSTSEPQSTPQGPRSTPEPQSTSEPPPTPQGPQSTSEPQPTPQGPQSTPQKPQVTPHPQTTPPGAQVTPSPQKTPQGPQATPKPQATPRGP